MSPSFILIQCLAVLVHVLCCSALSRNDVEVEGTSCNVVGPGLTDMQAVLTTCIELLQIQFVPAP